MNENYCTLEQITKIYGSKTVLDNVSLELKKGHIYGLVGKNGAGKTTLMRTIAGLSFPDKGQVTMMAGNRHDISELGEHFGFMIEHPALFSSMSAIDNLKMYALLKTGHDKLDFQNLLSLVGLDGEDKKKVRKFSLGMRQRLGIAIALIDDPKLLVLDEPINGLDPIGVTEIRRLIKKISQEKGTTILISSHNLPELYQVATHYIFLDGGVIKRKLTLEQLELEFKSYITIKCDDAKKAETIISQEFAEYEIKTEADWISLYCLKEDAEDIITTLQKKGVLIKMIEVNHGTLEDCFMEVIGADND